MISRWNRRLRWSFNAALDADSAQVLLRRRPEGLEVDAIGEEVAEVGVGQGILGQAADHAARLMAAMRAVAAVGEVGVAIALGVVGEAAPGRLVGAKIEMSAIVD